MTDERLKRLMAKARRLPLTPGVYIMHDSTGKIIYVGKAKALRNRVSQYFGSQEKHTEKVRQMVAHVHDFEYILCSSEFEALMLECSQIKQHMPKYNVLLKDSKGFHYIRVTKGPWRTVHAAMQKHNDDADYLGPYYSSYSVGKSVDAALKAFKLPQCNKSGKDMNKRTGRPCLNYHIGLCSAPCCGKIGLSEYEESVDQALAFLRDGSATAISSLTEQMNHASENLEFERAARIRDRIVALKAMGEKQKVVANEVSEQDVFGIATAPDKACFDVMRFSDGRLYDNQHFLVSNVDNPEQSRTDFIMQFYSAGNSVPPRVTCDGEIADKQLIERWLSEKRGQKCIVTVPQRGEQKSIVDMCIRNAAEYLAEVTKRRGRDTAGLDELAKLLGLRTPPEYIESYDISHTAGDETVAGMVVFHNGSPFRPGYRKFKVANFQNDDCASMQEVVYRRIREYEKHHAADDGDYFGRLPDLILLDGGKNQVAAVKLILDDNNVSIPLFGMVKDTRHRTRAITSDGDEIAIKSTRSAYELVYAIQEEVHRFAIGYHNQRRKRKMLGSSLTEISGIGETRAKALMAHFGTVDAISKADLADLKKVKGLTDPAAERVYAHFHPEDSE